MDTIPFLVTLPDEPTETGEMGLFSAFGPGAEIGLQQIPVDRLKANLIGVTESLLKALKDIKQVGKYKLKEVEIEVEVSADGGVSLIGTASLGGKGAIKLTFSE